MAIAISRRALLKQSIQASLGGVLAGAACAAAAADKVCADPKQIDSGQSGLRKSLNYAEAFPDQAKTCSACGFFQAGDAGCGTCMIFSGPVNASGHCDSWSARG